MEPRGSLPYDVEAALKQARALMDAGRIEDGLEKYFGLVTSADDAIVKAGVFLDAATRLSWYGHRDRAIPFLEEALRHCRDRRSLVSVAAQLELGSCLLWTDRMEEGSRLIFFAAAAAKESGDPLLLCLAALARAEQLAHGGDAEEAALTYESGAHLALKVDDQRLVACTQRLAALCFHRASTHRFQVARLDKALEFSSLALEQAECARDLPHLMKVRSFRCMLFWTRGEWRLLRVELEEASDVRRSLLQLPNEAFLHTSSDLAYRAWVGDADTLERALGELPGTVFPHPIFEPARWILAVKGRALQGRLPEARHILAVNASSIPPRPPSGHFDAWLQAAFHLLSCYCDVEDEKGAMRWYGLLAPYGDRLVPHTFPALELGRAESLCRKWTDASEWLSKARELTERERALPFLAMAEFELGLLHLRRSEGDDLAHARRHFEEAVKLFNQLGMHRHRDRAQHYLNKLRRRNGKGERELTLREKQVVCLVVDGKTDPQIAKELVRSPKTVARHIHNILVKVGLPNRTALAGWGARNGLDQERTKSQDIK